MADFNELIDRVDDPGQLSAAGKEIIQPLSDLGGGIGWGEDD
jgi:hypothetical protein